MMKKVIVIFIFLFISFPVFAQDSAQIDISPNIIDEKVVKRDLKEYTIFITNLTGRRLDIYPVVNDYTENEGRQEFLEPGSADKTTSLSSWIKFKRGVIEMEPGKKYEIPLEIKVDPFAIPGKRHAVIAFPIGPNSTAAEEKMLKESVASLIINFEVEDEIVERLQVKSFRAEKNINLNFPIKIILDVINTGNNEIFPAGNIYIFNRRGQEISKIEINKDNSSLAPGKEIELVNNWESGGGFGKFKARLEGEYGQKEKRDFQDTVYFWVLPFKYLIIFTFCLLILLILVVSYLFRRTYRVHTEPSSHKIVDTRSGILDLKNKE